MGRPQNLKKYPILFPNYFITSKQSGRFFQIFAAFSDYMNFNNAIRRSYATIQLCKITELITSFDSIALISSGNWKTIFFTSSIKLKGYNSFQKLNTTYIERQCKYIKFIYSEKATKYDEIFKLFLTLQTNFK